MTSHDLIWHPVGMDARDADAEARKRLGGMIEHRREELGLAQRDVVRHSTTYQNIVAGRTALPRVLRRAFRALGWDPDSLAGVLAGGDPAPLRQPEPGDDEGPDGLADAAALFEGIAGLTDEERRTVLEILERGRQRVRQRQLENLERGMRRIREQQRQPGANGQPTVS